MTSREDFHWTDESKERSSKPKQPAPVPAVEDSGEEVKDWQKVISERINHFATRHHKYEANLLHDAFNVILQLVPPDWFASITPQQDSKGVEQQLEKQYAEKGNQLKSIVGSIPDETEPLPVATGVEEAAKNYLDTHTDSEVRRMYGHHYRSFLAGASWQASQSPVSVPVGFAEWAIDSGYRSFTAMGSKVWCDESEYEWMGETHRLITTAELYNIYRQSHPNSNEGQEEIWDKVIETILSDSSYRNKDLQPLLQSKYLITKK